MPVINIEPNISSMALFPFLFKGKKEKGVQEQKRIRCCVRGDRCWVTTIITMTSYREVLLIKLRHEQVTHVKPRLMLLTPVVTPFSHLNTNSFNSQRQYLLCTKEPGVQKDRLPGAKFLLDFLALPCLRPAARKISREKCGQASKNKLLTWPSHHLWVLETKAQTELRFNCF